MHRIIAQFSKRNHSQSGINMVDLMMWLVIAALLLAAAIQGIGYYQKSATVHAMSSDAASAGSVAVTNMAQDGKLDEADIQAALTDTKLSSENIVTADEFDGNPYLRISNPSVTDLDAIYLFDPEGSLTAGVHLVPKNGLPDGTVPPPPPEYAFAGWGQSAHVVGTTGTVWHPLKGDPTGVLDGKNITSISNQYDFFCAVADGSAYCVGKNQYGKLGNGTMTDATVPVPVNVSGVLSGLTIEQVVVGYYHACALADGKAYCWGDQRDGRLGNGVSSTTGQPNPAAVVTSGALAGKRIASLTPTDTGTCALTTDGGVYCWGMYVADDASRIVSNVPVRVGTTGALAGKTITAVSGSQVHTCALATDSKAYCWGSNGDGKLGNGNEVNPSAPIAVAGAVGSGTVTKMVVGYDHSCAVASGELYCWGSNSHGKLGINSTNIRATLPTLVYKEEGLLAGKTVTHLQLSSYNTYAIADGEVFTWGYGGFGGLGQGTSTTNALKPVKPAVPDVAGGKRPISITNGPVVLYQK